MFRVCSAILALLLLLLPVLAVTAQGTAYDLSAVQAYALEHAAAMQAATTQFLTTAQDYYDRLAAHDFDYAAAWDADAEPLAVLVVQARADWLEASLHYEMIEGIVAGVPSLSYYDMLIDAGPAAADDPDNALAWTLILPDGTALDSPGNLFHSLSEPLLYGTVEAYVGLPADLDGDGAVTFTEVLPDANLLLGVVGRLDAETAHLITAVEAWEPTLDDAFTALLVMIPTMNEYFGQWKESAYVAGDAAEEASFVAVSRLFDILGILSGLDVVYDNVAPLVLSADDALHAQIDSGFSDLITFVDELYAEEQAGVPFAAEEVDFLGEEAQSQADTLAALVAQAAAVIGLEIVLD
ncbi:MAG: EfeM/EfeO family lipoprotein [Anaerolineae bacterium]|nr:EfeM/EfeO family lipoprotein [Anaerolineae bacterium]